MLLFIPSYLCRLILFAFQAFFGILGFLVVSRLASQESHGARIGRIDEAIWHIFDIALETTSRSKRPPLARWGDQRAPENPCQERNLLKRGDPSHKSSRSDRDRTVQHDLRGVPLIVLDQNLISKQFKLQSQEGSANPYLQTVWTMSQPMVLLSQMAVRSGKVRHCHRCTLLRQWQMIHGIR